MVPTVPLDRTAFFVNGASRTGARAYEPARQAMLDRGVRLFRSESVRDPTTLPDVIRRAVDDGCRLVVIGGGDGTIGCAAGVLATLDPPHRAVLGVLPLGTANDFARTLDIPAGLVPAIDVLVSGKVVDVDLGWANDRPFVNVASLGLAVGSAEALKPGMKKALGPAAYPLSTVIAYRRHRPFTLWMEFPQQDLDPLALDDVLQVSIGNGRYFGGGRTIAPDAGIDDHTFDVKAIKAGRLGDHLSLGRLLRSGSLIEHHNVRHLVTQGLRLTTEGPQAVNLDGEIATSSPVDFRLQRNAFDVVVPASVTHLQHEADHRSGSSVSSSTNDS